MQAYLPELSLGALAIAVIMSIIRGTNPGVMSLGLALIVGSFIGGLKVKAIIAGYPTNVFIMLIGITYLFAIAKVNGTLDKLTKFAIKSVRGQIALLPIILFFVAFVLSSLGPGAIAICALMAAPCALLAEEVGISVFLMATVVANGTQCGNMSPIAVAGVITKGILHPLGYTGWDNILWMNMLVTHLALAVGAYCVFGGLKLWKKNSSEEATALKNIIVEPFTLNQYLTLAGIAIMATGVMVFKLDIGLGALLVGSILTILRVADEQEAIKNMPWGAIIMVTGVGVLVNLMSKIGGMDLFATIMAKMSTPYTATLVVGFWSALLSAYASTIGIILPSFVPMAPELLAKIGGGGSEDLLALLSSIIVSGHVTDVSPLSTLGAIWVAQAGPKTDKQKLFNYLLYWGLAMSVIGPFICWLFFTVLRIP